MKKNSRKPLITIGMTCYNAAGTISRALKSALAQDWPNTEIVIVDDCSSDSSIDIICAFARDFGNIHLIRHEVNQGPGAARQTILDNANGDFLVFFDDDDESYPDRVTRQYDKIISFEKETGHKLVACFASGKRIYPNGYELPLTAIGSRPLVPQGPDMAGYLLFYKKNPGWFYGSGTPTCSLAGRKSTFVAAGGFDPNLRRLEDVDLSIRLALAGGAFVGCPEDLFIQYATEAPDKMPEKNLEAELYLAEKYQDYLRAAGYYEYAKRWPRLRGHHFRGEYIRMAGVLLRLLARYPVKATMHLFSTGPKRLRHERKMKSECFK